MEGSSDLEDLTRRIAWECAAASATSRQRAAAIDCLLIMLWCLLLVDEVAVFVRSLYRSIVDLVVQKALVVVRS